MADAAGRPTKGLILTTPALSSFAQKPFAGVFKGYLFNGFSRIMAQVPYFAIPFAAGTFSISSPHCVVSLSRRYHRIETWRQTPCDMNIGPLLAMPTATRTVTRATMIFSHFCDMPLTYHRLRNIHLGQVQVRVVQLQGGPPPARHGRRRPLGFQFIVRV